MYCDDKEEMLDAAARQLHAQGAVWPTINDVMNKSAPTPPPKWDGVSVPEPHFPICTMKDQISFWYHPVSLM